MQNAGPNLALYPTLTLPAGLPSWLTVEAVGDTLLTFQPFDPETLTVDDAIEILTGFHNLYDVLKDHPDAKVEIKTSQGQSGDSQGTAESVCGARSCEQP